MNPALHSRFTTQRGHSLRLSLPRKIVGDLIYFAKKVPTVPVQRVVNVRGLMTLRKQSQPRIGWCSLFTKAYAIVSNEVPELRQCHLEYPWTRLYQHPQPVASIAVERTFDGTDGVFFAHIPGPEAMSLPTLEDAIHYAKTAPVRDAFGFYFFFYKLPRGLRRMTWWYLMNVRGSKKSTFMGTYGVSVYSSLGAESLHPLSTLTTTLNYGFIGDDGNVMVRIVYDHRVLDGAMVARALNRVEEVLNGDIASELKQLATVKLASTG
ncbi:hypothetical protein BH11PLA2_BH11PLA2_17770 [soil metagenome]